MSVRSLESLNTWVKAKSFALRVYHEVVPLFPAEEKWSMAQQIRRSANSIPANIAEGYGRFHYQDNIRFSYIARGSLEETLSHLVMCVELSYISKPIFDSLANDGEKLTQLINGYINYLKHSKQGKNETNATQSLRENNAFYEVIDDDSPFPNPNSQISTPYSQLTP